MNQLRLLGGHSTELTMREGPPAPSSSLHSRGALLLRRPSVRSDAESRNSTMRPSPSRKFAAVVAVLMGLALLPLASSPAGAQGSTTDICSRTQQVKDAIVAASPANDTCGNIDLTTVMVLNIANLDTPLTTLKSGDFDDLTNLKSLNLSGNKLSSLPNGIFDDLTNLEGLDLSDNNLRLPSSLLTTLFAQNTKIIGLNLSKNQLTALPSSTFEKNTALKSLDLALNDFNSLPATLLSKNTALEHLYLFDAGPNTYPSGFFAANTNLKGVYFGSRYASFTGTQQLPVWARWERSLKSTVSVLDQDYHVDTPPSSLVRLLADALAGLASLKYVSFDRTELTCLPTLPDSVTHISLDGTLNEQSSLPVSGRAATTYPQCSKVPRLLPAPTSISVQRVSPTSLSASWSAPIGAGSQLTGYKARYRAFTLASGSPGTWQAAQAGASASSITLTGLTSSDVYEVQLASVSAVGTGPWSASAWVRLPPPVCSRTPAVRDAIVAAVKAIDSTKTDCASIRLSEVANISSPLQLARKNISVLQIGDFDSLLKVPFVDLSGNLLTSLPANVFNDLQRVQAIVLNRNQLTKLSSDVFATNTMMQTLALGGNRLTALPDSIFKENTSLTRLVLTDNGLTSLHKDTFKTLTALTELHAQNNRLTSVDRGLLSTNAELKTLNLSNNQLSALPDGFLNNNTKLTKLYLADNRLNSVSSGSPSSSPFKQNTLLEELDLARNRLTALPSNVFNTNTALTKLYLSDNDLRTVFSQGSSLFNANTALSILDISGNRLTSFPQNTFTTNTALSELGLHNPGLTELPGNLFSANTSLQRLYLSGYTSNRSSWLRRSRTVNVNGKTYSFQDDPSRVTQMPDALFTGLSSLSVVSIDRSGALCMPALSISVLVEDGLSKSNYPVCTSSRLLPPPTELRSSGIGTTSRVLTWRIPQTSSGAPFRYDVRYRTRQAADGTGTDGTWQPLATTPSGTDRSFTLRGLDASEVYEIQLASVISGGTSGERGPWSASADVTAPRTPGPSGPSQPSAAPGAGSNTARRDLTVQRIAGKNRYETAAKVASGLRRKSQQAIVVSGTSSADGLAVAALTNAGSSGTRPVLLTDPNALSPETSAWLRANNISKVTLVGGTSAVSASVETALGTIVGAANVERVAGADRFATALAVAKRVGAPGAFCGTSQRTVIVVNGFSQADALSAGSLAAYGRHPIIMTAADRLTDGVADYLTGAKANRVLIVGGKTAVSEDVEKALKAVVSRVDRVEGADRWATSLALTKLLLSSSCYKGSDLAFAKGRGAAADALAVSAWLGERAAPLLLTESDRLPDAMADGLRTLSLPDKLTVTIIGGPAAVSQAVESRLTSILRVIR